MDATTAAAHTTTTTTTATTTSGRPSPHGPPSAPTHALRLLLPSRCVGALLGPGGAVIARLRARLGAHIRVGPPVALGGVLAVTGGEWADARVVTISSRGGDGPAAGGGAGGAPGPPPSTPTSGAGPTTDNPTRPPCPAEIALVCIYDICQGCNMQGRAVSEGDGAAAATATPPSSSARLLVDAASGQVGALIGRGGSIAAALRSATGAGLRVLPHREAGCGAAGPGDAVVALSGSAPAVRAALAAVASRLRACPAGPAAASSASMPPASASWFGAAASAHQHQPGSSRCATPLAAALAAAGAPDGWGALASSGGGGGAAPRAPWGRGRSGAPSPGCSPTAVSSGAFALASPTAAPATSFRLLVPARAVGTLIGRGGETVARLRAGAPGARVTVHPPSAGAPDRVVQFSDGGGGGCGGLPPAVAALLAAVDALLADHGACAVAGGHPGRVGVRLLVGAASARAALGPRACLAADVRAEAGAAVRVAPLVAGGTEPAPLPATAAEGDVVLSLEGAPGAVAASVRLVAALLHGAGGCGRGSGGGGSPAPAASSAVGGGAPQAAPAQPASPGSPGSSAGWAPPALPRLQLKPSRLGGGGGGKGEAAGHHAAAATTPPSSSSAALLLPLGPAQAAVLFGGGGGSVAGGLLAQVRAVTGAAADGDATATHPALRLTGSPAQVMAARAMVGALLMAAGAEGAG